MMNNTALTLNVTENSVSIVGEANTNFFNARPLFFHAKVSPRGTLIVHHAIDETTGMNLVGIDRIEIKDDKVVYVYRDDEDEPFMVRSALFQSDVGRLALNLVADMVNRRKFNPHNDGLMLDPKDFR